MLDILVIAFAVLLSAGVLLLVLEPVWRAALPATDEASVEDNADILAELYARRDALYASIKELEFDHRVGKISTEDYERFSGRLKREAAEVLRQIEEVKARQAAIRERLEAAVREIARGAAPAAKQEPAPVPAEVSRSTARPRFCTQCGHRLQPSDRFCSQCGAPVRGVAA